MAFSLSSEDSSCLNNIHRHLWLCLNMILPEVHQLIDVCAVSHKHKEIPGRIDPTGAQIHLQPL